jgi:hypothetical protein
LYAGHTGKFDILMLATLCLWAVDRAACARSALWGVVAGGCLGMAFVAQQDVALFFAMFLGSYAVYAVVRENGWRLVPLARVMTPMLAIALWVASRSLLSGYTDVVRGSVTVGGEDPRAKWEFATQWSWPPEESIDFIAPGYMGWRSGEAEGPYWGRMGRSAGWEATGKGFQNFKLENQYLGMIPLAFALFAVAVAASGGCRASRADVWFWSAATLLALLLAFGKYFPLYRLLYELPVVNSIRNPNKFLQVFQVGFGILAAFGLESALRLAGVEARRDQPTAVAAKVS